MTDKSKKTTGHFTPSSKQMVDDKSKAKSKANSKAKPNSNPKSESKSKISSRSKSKSIGFIKNSNSKLKNHTPTPMVMTETDKYGRQFIMDKQKMQYQQNMQPLTRQVYPNQQFVYQQPMYVNQLHPYQQVAYQQYIPLNQQVAYQQPPNKIEIVQQPPGVGETLLHGFVGGVGGGLGLGLMDLVGIW